jgi:hypothetical protein
LQIEPITNSLDVRARLSILNPRRDAVYTLQVIDSAGNERILRDVIQGFTIELQRGSLESAPPGVFGGVEITKLECRTLLYRNVGTLPFVINRIAPRRNVWFSLPESQFPITIAPNESRPLTVCFAPLQQQSFRDTLVLDAFCVQDIVPLSGEGIPLVRVSASRCATEIVLTTNTAPLNYFMEQNYPNPASGLTTIMLGLNQTSSVRLNIYNALGVLIDTPFQGTLEKGIHEVNVDISSLETGVYFYETITSQGHQVRRLNVVR